MANTEKVLQQKAYPSASAFDQVQTHEPVVGAFGSPAVLPRVEPEPALQPEESQAALGAFRALTLDDVQDPALRSALQGRASEPQHDDPFAVAPATGATASSPFGPDETEPEVAPLTSALPVISKPDVAPAPKGTIQQASYPSVSAATTALPKIQPKRTARWMPLNLKAMVQADQSLTAPIRGLGRLSQKQFSIKRNRDREKFAREKENARDILNFTLRLAETMFHYGADTLDVDNAVVAVCAAYGLDDVEVDITNQSVIINYVSDGDGSADSERFSHTVVRVVRSNSDNYASLSDIYHLIHRITREGLERSVAEKQLTAINTQKKPYSPLAIFGANIFSAAALTYGIGGSIQASIVSAVVFVGIFFVGRLMAKLQMPSFFNMAAAAGMITFVAILLSDEKSFLTQIGKPVSAPHIVAAGLMMLLPTTKLVTAAQDAINGFPLTAAGKFMSTGMSFLGLVVGIGTAVTVLGYMGATPLQISETKFNTPNVWDHLIFMTAATLTLAITTHARLGNLIAIAIITFISIGSYDIFNAILGTGAGRGNTAVAAIIIGLLSTWLAYKTHTPQVIYSIPGITFLLPGLSIFRGMYTMTVESNSSLGLNGMITAASIIVAMAAGVAFGTFLMQYFIQRFGSQEREDASQVLHR